MEASQEHAEAQIGQGCPSFTLMAMLNEGPASGRPFELTFRSLDSGSLHDAIPVAASPCLQARASLEWSRDRTVPVGMALMHLAAGRLLGSVGNHKH